jgi:hypothetical protein
MATNAKNRSRLVDPSSIPEFDRAMRALIRVPKSELETEQAKGKPDKSKSSAKRKK